MNFERKPTLPIARLRLLAGRLHDLGPRSTYELLRELLDGADVLERLEIYAALDPATVRAVGGDAMPPQVRVIGKRS